MITLTVILIVLVAVGIGEAKEANVYWRDYQGTIPSDAVPTGHGTYIAQVVLYNNGIVPGTLYPDRKLAVSEGPRGRAEYRTNIKVLCSPVPHSLTWEYINVYQLNPTFLSNAVVGGYEEGATAYIGKVFHEGQWKIGKVFPPTVDFKGLRVWWNSGEGYHPADFQILMVK